MTCQNEIENNQGGYFKMLMRSVVLITTILAITIFKNKYLKTDISTFYIALLAVISSFLFSIIGWLDSHMFNYLALGIGIGTSIQMLKV